MNRLFLERDFGSIHQPGPNSLPMERRSGFVGPAVALDPTSAGVSEVRRPVPSPTQTDAVLWNVPLQ